MRVIGGELKRRRLHGAAGDAKSLRPTSDLVRESLFNLLDDYVRGAVFLDLFAGTGAVGIEALSRGAERVVFVENSAESLKILRRNVSDLSLESRCVVRQMDVSRFLDSAAAAGEIFDIIFADPPYDAGFQPMLLEKLGPGGMIAPYGLAVIERRNQPEVQSAGNLVLADSRSYGKSTLTLWRKRPSEIPSE